MKFLAEAGGANDGGKAAWFRTGHRIFLRKWYSLPRLRGLPPFLGAVAWHLARGRFGLAAGSIRGYFAPLPAQSARKYASNCSAISAQE